MQEAVQAFFQLIKNKKLQEAYQSTSPDFQTNASFKDFEDFLTTTGILDSKSVIWTDFEQDASKGMGGLRGKITKADGTESPLVIFAETKDGGHTWQVVNITPATTVPTHPGAFPDIPELAELNATVQRYLTLFVMAVTRNDFSEFYDSIATIWRVETTAEKLRAVFQEFIDKKLDLNFVFSSMPVLSAKPIINSRGFLELHGYFSSAERHLLFDLQFTYEHPEWKLLSIDVSSATLKP